MTLDPLARLDKMQSLFLSDTCVCDLTPIKNLAKIKVLTFSGTRVYDLSTLSGLKNLETLAFSRTLVGDMSPLAELPNLVPCARRTPRVGGLTFASCPLSDPALRGFARIKNPDRTVETMAYLNSVTPSSHLPADFGSSQIQLISDSLALGTQIRTNTQDELQYRKALVDRLIALENLGGDGNKRGIGDNFPPEPISDISISSEDSLQLRQSLIEVKAQLREPSPNVLEVLKETKKISDVMKKIAIWSAAKADMTLEEFLKSLGSTSGKFLAAGAIVYIAGESLHLVSWIGWVLKEILDWFHFIGLPG